MAENNLLKIAESFKILDSLCFENMNNMETSSTEADSRVRNERVNFKKIVLKEAQKLLS